ncbi:acyl-CoA dehydrogenase family protein [Actinokineospora soli]|uniref:Acyl-CoA dehydrogenase family protein n=1 Tax=Actinokineospora soli TaxID=1048753 RepID=A0ABW2TRU1_9PSEU
MRQWTDEQRELRARHVEPFREWGEGHIERDRVGEFDHGRWKLVADSGVLGLPFSPEHGGQGKDLATTMSVFDLLGQECRDTGLGFCVSTHVVSTGVPIDRYGSPELKARFMPGICDGSRIGAHAITERQGGSDAARMRTSAQRVGDDYVLNGEKCFISSGPVADLILVYARTGPGTGPFGITTFVVERDSPGLEIGEPIDKMGLRTSPYCDIRFTNCVVPAANVVGRVGKGFLILDYVMTWEILCSFAISLGSMRHRYERCVEFARARKQFGSRIGSFQLISSKIVEMKIRLETASRWLYATAERFLAGEDVMVDVSIGKLLVSEANVASAADAVQIFGARGYSTEYGLEKDLRDATGGTIYSGTSEVQRDKIARMIGVS